MAETGTAGVNASGGMQRDMRGGFLTQWVRWGQGEREAVMIHCSLAHAGAWRGVAHHLEDVLRMTAFDLPGHGGSGPWEDQHDLQDVTAAMALELLRGPTDIIGHSFGATVALRLAVEHPEFVRSLTLIEPVFFAVAAADNPGVAARQAGESALVEAALERGDNAEAARLFVEGWGDGRQWEDYSEAMRAQFTAQIPLVAAGWPAIYDDRARMLRSGALERIAAPCLLIEGGASPPDVALINAGLARRLPNAHRRVIAGAGHMAPITHPAQVGAEILRFLEEFS